MDILNDLLNMIKGHAQERPDEEVCGFIGCLNGQNTVITNRCTNEHEKPKEHFRIGLNEYQEVAKQMVILASYHSHPQGPLKASPHDVAVSNETQMPSFIYDCTTQDMVAHIPTQSHVLRGRPFLPLLFDCLTLCLDYYRYELKIPVGDFRRTWKTWMKIQNQFEEYIKANDFEIFLKPKKHDVVIMSLHGDGLAQHCGIYLGDDVILHQRNGGRSAQTVYSGFWEKATCMVWRHKKFIE